MKLRWKGNVKEITVQTTTIEEQLQETAERLTAAAKAIDQALAPNSTPELVAGRAYLCEVWHTPPGLMDCQSQEMRLAVAKFSGYKKFTPQQGVRYITCGDTQFRLDYDGREIETWEIIDTSFPVGLTYQVVPLRALEPDSQ